MFDIWVRNFIALELCFNEVFFKTTKVQKAVKDVEDLEEFEIGTLEVLRLLRGWIVEVNKHCKI